MNKKIRTVTWIAGGIAAAFSMKKYGKEIRKQLYIRNAAKHPGNDAKYETVLPAEGGPLSGMKIAYLGSSVTYGAASQGISFADYITKRTGAKMIKEAVSGTTLTDDDRTSYVSRLKEMDPEEKIDLFVVQLSTNDATKKKPLGIVEAKEPYDTKTVTGAIQEILTYIAKTWNCPVIFYTSPYYKSEEYAEMVQRLQELQSWYDFGLLDLYNDLTFNNITGRQKKLYMADAIHPTKAGYLLWWTPEFEKKITEYLSR